MAQSTPEIHFFGAQPRTPPGICPWTPLGGGAYSPPPPPKPPSCWLLAMLVCNALRALHNALRVLNILCLRYFPAFSFHESCIPAPFNVTKPAQTSLTHDIHNWFDAYPSSKFFTGISIPHGYTAHPSNH